MGFFSIADISSSGMGAEQLRMDIIANNIANSETTHTEGGGPYKRRSVVFSAAQSSFSTVFSNKIGGGVKVAGVVQDQTPAKMVYDPNHPDADREGYVKYPNISVVNEMVDMISATRAYEANVTIFNLAKNMELRTLDIGR